MSGTYRTVQGDMWDSIAHKTLGSADYTGALMAKNRACLDYYIFPSGILLELPETRPAAGQSLPPWKRGAG